MYRKPRTITLTVANGQTTSGVIDLTVYVLAGIILPAALTSTAITLTVCDTRGGTYQPLYDSDGNQVSLAVAASRAVGLSGAEADALAAFPYAKLVCGSAEGGDRTIVAVLK